MNSSPSNINLPHSELVTECLYHRLLLLPNVTGEFLGSLATTSKLRKRFKKQIRHGLNMTPESARRGRENALGQQSCKLPGLPPG